MGVGTGVGWGVGCGVVGNGVGCGLGWGVGCGLVFQSTVLRGILTAIFWLKKPEYEVRVFADVTEAVVWGRKHAFDQRSDAPRADSA